MIMEINPEVEAFHALLESYFRQMTAVEPLQKVKAKAWSRYMEAGLPTRRSEVFRYVNLRRLFGGSYAMAEPNSQVDQPLSPLSYPESRESVLVFVNGHYRPDMSSFKALPAKAIVLPMQEAFKTYGSFLNNHWSKALKDETDPFVLLNGALHSHAAFVYLPPKTVCEVPLHIVNIIQSSQPALLAMPRVLVFAGAQSQINVVSSLRLDSGKPHFINMAVDFAVEEDAHVRYTQNALGIGEEQWCFDATRATLKRNSTFRTVQFTDGGAGVRHDYRVALTGENAEAVLSGCWMLENKKEAHVHVLMDHQAPYCRSMQLFKGVLNGTSESSFEGKIYVRQAAQKTEAFQLNHNLILSERANAQSKPNLEIFADDVKASHGATVGQLDKEQLFYMKSRGFSDADAKNLLIRGFCKEVFDSITQPSLVQRVSEWTNNYIYKG